MAKGTVIDARPAQRGRLVVGNISKGQGFQGMRTVQFNGVGEQLVENMYIDSAVYRKMEGNSVLVDTGVDTDIMDIFHYKNDTQNQLVFTYKDGSNYKLRAYNLGDGTISTPTGGAGDVAFTSSDFSFVQLGLFGYIANDSATTQLYKWDGTQLVVVTNAPTNIIFLTKEGRRLVAGREGFVEFSSRITTDASITNWTGGTGLNAASVYNVANAGLPKAAVPAQGYTVLFWEYGAELHRTEPNNAGDNLSGETRVGGFNYSGAGVDNDKKVVSTPNNIYFVNEEGVWEMSPFSGGAKNLIENSGAMQRYWDGLDTTDSVIEYYPDKQFVCVHIREQGEGTNDRILIVDVGKDSRPMYFKTKSAGSTLGLVDRELYMGGTKGKIYKLFDSTTFLDGNDGDTKCRVITEWNTVTNSHSYKSFRRASIFANLHPDSSFTINVFQDGFIDVETTSETYQTADVTNDSSVVGQIGKYVVGIGRPNTLDNTDVVKRKRFLSRFITYSMEIVEESNEDFRINSFTLDYAQRGTDVVDGAMANQLFALSA